MQIPTEKNPLTAALSDLPLAGSYINIRYHLRHNRISSIKPYSFASSAVI